MSRASPNCFRTRAQVRMETIISVRGVDPEVWEAFQGSVRKKYGNLYGKLGPEVTSALKAWLEAPPPPKKLEQLDISKYFLKMDVPSVLVRGGALSVKSLIYEAVKSLGGEATIRDVIAFVHEKYGPVKESTIATAMSDLAVNGPPSSLYSVEARFLQRVSRGRYRLTKVLVQG